MFTTFPFSGPNANDTPRQRLGWMRKRHIVNLPNVVPEEGILSFIDQGLVAAEDFWDVERALRANLLQNANDQIEWLGVAFAHQITVDVQRGPKGQHDFIDGKDAFGSVESNALQFWGAVASSVSNPVMRARLHHILFIARQGNPGEHAREAALAYLEIGRGTWSGVKRVRCLDWALHLYKSVGDTAGAARVIPVLLAIAQESLDGASSTPGISLPALELVANEDPSHSTLTVLLAQARVKYPDSRLTTDTIRIQKIIYKGDGAKIALLNREMVESYLAEASQTEGLLRMKFLEDGAQLASKYGITDLRDEAVRQMQGMDFESMGFVKFGAEVRIEGEELDAIRRQIDARIAFLVEGQSLGESLSRLISIHPPSGSISANEEQAQSLDQEFPLQALFTTTQVRSDGLPSYTDTLAGDARDRKLSQLETLHMFGSFEPTSRLLFEILGAHSPTEEELTALLTREGISDETTARHLAISLLAFQSGDYFSSAARALPVIERLARAQLALLGVATYRTQSGSRRGGIAQLAGLLTELEPFLDESWFRFLQTFLVGKFGPNFRNELLHGYHTEVRAQECVLTLLCALYLLGFTVRDPDPSGSAAVGLAAPEPDPSI